LHSKISEGKRNMTNLQQGDTVFVATIHKLGVPNVVREQGTITKVRFAFRDRTPTFDVVTVTGKRCKCRPFDLYAVHT